MANSTDISFDSFWNILDGERRGSSRVHHGTNPATGKPLWDAPIATAEDVDEAVRAAQKAFPKWSATEYSSRVQLLNQFADAFLKLAPEFTTLLQAETGRTKDVAQIEVHWSVLWLRHPASQVLPHQVLQDEDKEVTIRYEPRGVVAAVCPWNYPIMLAFGKIAPALAVGNCVIVKPAPSTPYTSLKCIELAQSIFPPGVLQVLADDGHLGPLLVEHPGIAHISFTGSTPTGKKIMESAAKTLKKVTLELGGNDAAIILPDVDIEKVAPQVAMGAWWNSGQSCIAIKRVYIHESIYERFLRALVEFTRSHITVGCSSVDGATMLGPIQNKMQYQKLRDLIEDCRREGCNFSLDQPLTAQEELARQSLESGFFLWPIIVDNPPADSPLVTEEQFGPIIPCMPFSDIEAVISAANSTSTGLSASVWGEDAKATQRIADSLDVGTVFVNGPSRPDPRVPFSGHKESGIGVEYGLMGLIEYCQVKSVVKYRASS
ncbi:aldehyde dehydrogenase [Aspergillus udagawae]|uniref:aldehyde dehydrogenase (NAD(+)) n=1 Tax=Aspergillus udagawae TaxID=91492 RepID=A0ABQ1B378_9EURO|nr:aldehyde dehydrogenase [Aspergillus udagawae]GFG06108.1 aldehyde dehydrogenase [Aspergillus udagawae]